MYKIYDKNKFGKIKRIFTLKHKYISVVEECEEYVIYYEDIKCVSLIRKKDIFQIKIDYSRNKKNLFSIIINDVNSPIIIVNEILKKIKQNQNIFMPISISYT